jgi:predicted site-specific integrase-resolvase
MKERLSSMEKNYSISEFSELAGVSKSTLRRYDKENKLKPAYTSKGGHRRYTESQLYRLLQKNKRDVSRLNIGYVRVSSKKQSDDLERQYTLMENYLVSKGEPFEIIKSIGSGIDYNNQALNTLLDLVISGKVNKVFIMYKDRLVRFGFELLQNVFKRYNVEIEIINHKNNTMEEELVIDLIQIVTVFSLKLNGKRKYNINKFKRELENDSDNDSN